MTNTSEKYSINTAGNLLLLASSKSGVFKLSSVVGKVHQVVEMNLTYPPPKL